MTQIKAQIEDTTSDYDKEKLQERLAKLAGGVAVIKVGAATEVELKEKKHRIEDALSTTRAAVEEGLVAGGGTTLLQAIPALDKLKLEGDEQVGVDIVRKALEAPARQIADNAGASGEVVVDAGQRRSRPARATTPSRASTADMFKAGIVDAAKVTRSALQNAASIAAMVLTTETLITDIPEKARGRRRRWPRPRRWRRDGLLVRLFLADTKAPGIARGLPIPGLSAGGPSARHHRRMPPGPPGRTELDEVAKRLDLPLRTAELVGWGDARATHRLSLADGRSYAARRFERRTGPPRAADRPDHDPAGRGRPACSDPHVHRDVQESLAAHSLDRGRDRGQLAR